MKKEDQDTQDELQKRNHLEELEERERRHFSSKDRSYGSKRDTGDRIVPRGIDADDSDVEVKSDDESDCDIDDDDEDDTEALLVELEQIKKERAGQRRGYQMNDDNGKN